MERQIWEHSPQIHVTFDTVTIQKIKIMNELRVWDVFMFARTELKSLQKMSNEKKFISTKIVISMFLKQHLKI